jgi:hypothetical protein
LSICKPISNLRPSIDNQLTLVCKVSTLKTITNDNKKDPVTAPMENPALTGFERKAPIPIRPEDIRGNKRINQAASSIL